MGKNEFFTCNRISKRKRNKVFGKGKLKPQVYSKLNGTEHNKTKQNITTIHILGLHMGAC